MRYSSQGWFRERFGFLRRQFLQEGDLPFTSVLSETTIAPALEAIDVCWKDRVSWSSEFDMHDRPVVLTRNRESKTRRMIDDRVFFDN